jgi:hypothetical protein
MDGEETGKKISNEKSGVGQISISRTTFRSF